MSASPKPSAIRWMCTVAFCLLSLQSALAEAEQDKPLKTTAIAARPLRVLHFPKDRSLGRIMVQDANIKRQIQTFYHWVDGADWYEHAEYLGEAQGDVAIPPGKRVALFVNKNAIKDLSPLLNLKPDDLYMLSMQGMPARDRCMPYIAHLSGLKELDLKMSSISTEGMKHITKLHSLERLTLPLGTTNRGLSYVAELKSLKGLYFYGGGRVTNAGLRLLSKLTSLEELAVGGKPLDDAGLVHLANLKSLKYLLLLGRTFSNDGLAHLQRLPSLKILNINHPPFSNAGLAHLSGLKGLENLNLSNTKVTDEGLAQLKSIRTLKKLSLSGTQVTDNGLVHIKEMGALEYLDLPVSGITDRGLAHIVKLDKLKHLSVSCRTGSPLTDRSLKYVGQLDSLEKLSIGGTAFTDAGMIHLAKLTKLKKLTLAAEFISDEGLARLTTLKSLNKLWLLCEKITISGLSHLKALPNLVELMVNHGVQDNSGLEISGLTKLETLRLRLNVRRKGKDRIYDSVRDEDLACLAKLKNLKLLQIGVDEHSMVTDAGMAHLADLTRMKRLSIGSPYLTDKTLSYLENMKRLNTLMITGNFTDAGLRYLEGLKALSYLKFGQNSTFTPAALRRLRRNLPNLQTLQAAKRN